MTRLKNGFQTLWRSENKLGIPVATLLDTKGPEIRIGAFENESGVVLKRGQTFILTTDEIQGTNERCSVSFKGLPQRGKERHNHFDRRWPDRHGSGRDPE